MSEDEIGPAATPDGLSSAVDDVAARLLGQPRSMRRHDVSQGADVSLRSARKFWHALGFPNVRNEDAVFTEADLAALQAMVTMVRTDVFDETTALALTRAFGRTTDRLAAWQTQLMAEVIGELTPALPTGPGEEDSSRAVPDRATALATAAKIADLADSLEPLLVYAWRRHLTAAISRMVADAEPASSHTGLYRSVGFADLVSFTQLVRRLSERQLAEVVQRFEALASDVVSAHGGRVVKTVGDEVLFVTVDAAPAAAIALDLLEAIDDDRILPDLRVGVASGQVLSRLGDVFGTTVNRASRLTAAARPGSVLVDDALAAALARVSGFEMTAAPRRVLRGIGPVTPWELRRADPGRRRGTTDQGET